MSRRRTRELALQVMFEVDVGRQPLQDALARVRGEVGETEWAYLHEICTGTWARRPELDRILQGLTTDWALDRLANTDRTVLRLAAYELLHTETPPQVVINEAVELAKRYGTEDSGRFVNGVLGALVRRHRRAPVGDDH
ncbi:MAG: transcription antitermination factor NusB [Armatimonadota bacterium]|nr:transcription antitermination factor NusB [Armatimonadota bacterium]MDR7450386.1 transcription antitermination factor NusB [Armatimonadota bacterium]MDR7467031.1 transcription antitermination factor NusB [Armatimonadota bacterium]MDR7493427.1 transcription antitermination factor NusB [Armatimonadota bacterium]MDR7498692.1 transcription antitermination factor NusB [Armatimonadota bacterium]